MKPQNDARSTHTEAPHLSAERTSDDFEKFVYLLSHDVRNSARALIELPQWIMEDLEAEGHSISGSLAENLDLMNTHTRRLDRMLIDLLVHSRVGRMQSVETVDLGDTLDMVLEQLSIPVGFKIHQNFGKNSIRMGPRDAFTLIDALISNAIKHHDSEVGVVNISSQQTSDTCIIRIQDDGPGIHEKYRDRIFEAMTTLKPRDVVEGSGMGLAIARKIVSVYGGKIELLPNGSARNTTIEITFPI
ncbi:HAMP domain-containing histidine kinase [Litoreibacter sp.]|nr:HAMP domain-containing histidine kinase [Litoreibacter sp.]